MTGITHIAPQADTGLLFHLGLGIDPKLNARVRALATALKRDLLPGVREIMPAYSCLQVQMDPVKADHDNVQEWVAETLARLPDQAGAPGRLVEVPVVYGGEHGPDLGEVARRSGLSPQEVIQRHQAREYPCFLVGFSPGFPFLGGLEPALSCPRLQVPRASVPVGAVGIGGDQTGLYPLGGPGGWRLIGRTPLLFYDPRQDPPALIRAGDRLRMKAVPAAEFPPLPAPVGVEAREGRPVFKVLHPGGFTSAQDQGRWGWQDLGIPISGALDQFSLAAANWLVGNPPESAALELTLLGPKLKLLAPALVACCGADLGFKVDGRPAPRGQSLALDQGQVISFGGPKDGARGMLAVAGGLANPQVMGSRGAYPLGRLGAPLAPGQVVRALSAQDTPSRRLPDSLLPVGGQTRTLRVVAGPNGDFFTSQGQEAFFQATFQVTQASDRRGARLAGPAIPLRPDGPTSILSEPNVPGVIQIPPGGAPLILLREQTVGGYAKIACVISADLDLLAMARPGESLRFEPVTLQEAIAIARAKAASLARLAQS